MQHIEVSANFGNVPFVYHASLLNAVTTEQQGTVGLNEGFPFLEMDSDDEIEKSGRPAASELGVGSTVKCSDASLSPSTPRTIYEYPLANKLMTSVVPSMIGEEEEV